MSDSNVSPAAGTVASISAMNDAAYAEGARRMIDTLLRNAHSRSVKLRIPAPAIAGDDAEQLGHALPLFQDVELKPAVFRKSYAASAAGGHYRRELLLSATTVETLTGSEGYGSANSLFATAFGVLIDETLLSIDDVQEVEAGGTTCGYRLTLQQPSTTA